MDNDLSANDVQPKDEHGNVLSLFRRLWRLLAPGLADQKRNMAVAYLLGLGSVGAAYLGPYFISQLLDRAIPSGDMDLFLLFSGALLLSLIALLGFLLARSFFLSRASERLFLDLRVRLFATLMRKPASFYSQHETGDLLTRISSDTEHLSVLLFDYVFLGLNGVLIIGLFIILMLLWEWRLGLFTALSLPCYVLLLGVLHKPVARAASKARTRLSQQNDTVIDLLSGIKEIWFYQQSQESENRFRTSAEAFTNTNINSVHMAALSFDLMEFFAQLLSAFPFMVGGYLICRGDPLITVGTLVAYNLYLMHIAHTLSVILYGVTKLAQSDPIVRRIQNILDVPEEHLPVSAGLDGLMESTQIEYRNVSFNNISGHPVLKQFSLTIEPGEKIALMGPNGAGKSVLIDMLTRQIQPDRGDILFGGYPIDSYPLPVYLMHFAYVRQKPYLFKTSIRNNIATGWYHVPLEVIIDTARRVHIHDAIASLPHSYETLISEKTAPFSGGQLQRLALARALVRDPEILLLDEFTSALDRATEQSILDDIFLNFEKQTVICVTHSLAVANRFSRIVFIDKYQDEV